MCLFSAWKELETVRSCFCRKNIMRFWVILNIVLIFKECVAYFVVKFLWSFGSFPWGAEWGERWKKFFLLNIFSVREFSLLWVFCILFILFYIAFCIFISVYLCCVLFIFSIIIYCSSKKFRHILIVYVCVLFRDVNLKIWKKPWTMTTWLVEYLILTPCWHVVYFP